LCYNEKRDVYQAVPAALAEEYAALVAAVGGASCTDQTRVESAWN